jgi:hypothetical protein
MGLFQELLRHQKPRRVRVSVFDVEVLYLYIRCTRTSVSPVPILAIFVPVHRYTGPTFLRLLVPVHILYRSYFSAHFDTSING